MLHNEGRNVDFPIRRKRFDLARNAIIMARDKVTPDPPTMNSRTVSFKKILVGAAPAATSAMLSPMPFSMMVCVIGARTQAEMPKE